MAVILLDEPNYGYHWGSEGAAPAFKRIIQRLINMDDSLQKEQIPKKKIQAKQTWAENIEKEGRLIFVLKKKRRQFLKLDNLIV